jgi:hypothetical protein
MSQTSNWPIIVGGQYESKDAICPDINRTTFARVTALDGDTVYYRFFRVDREDGREQDCQPSACSTGVFRATHRPEDQSPLPAYRAFLEKVIAVAEGGQWASKGRYLAHEARELLAEAKPQEEEGEEAA